MHYLNRMGRRDTTVCSISNDLKILDEKRLHGELTYCLNRHHSSVETKDDILNRIARIFLARTLYNLEEEFVKRLQPITNKLL